MRQVTDEDRARMLAHEIGKHDAALAGNRKVLAASHGGNEILHAVGEIARLENELAVMQAALDAIKGGPTDD